MLFWLFLGLVKGCLVILNNQLLLKKKLLTLATHALVSDDPYAFRTTRAGPFGYQNPPFMQALGLVSHPFFF